MSRRRPNLITIRVYCDRGHPKREVTRFTIRRDQVNRPVHPDTAHRDAVLWPNDGASGDGHGDGPTTEQNTDGNRFRRRLRCPDPGCTINVVLGPELADDLVRAAVNTRTHHLNLAALSGSVGVNSRRT